jgi:hypothetical protein
LDIYQIPTTVDFSSSRKGIDNSTGAGYSSGHRKGRLKILYIPICGKSHWTRNGQYVAPGHTERLQTPWPHQGFTVGEGLKEAESDLSSLKKLGVDLNAITEKLQADGVSAFAASFDQLLDAVEEKHKRIVAGAKFLVSM